MSNSGKSDTAESPLVELKHLLFEPEQEQLHDLVDRLDDPHKRAAEIAEVLPQAVGLQHGGANALATALEEPITECVKQSVARDPHSFADALFPVMGPAIRRSITETLKSFVQSINQALEQSVSAKGLLWRIESLRTGVSFAEVVLRHTLAYRVEQVFLIQPGTGLLIQHVADERSINRDADAVSAMLTAIEDFVKDAFASGPSEGLDTVDLGEHTVWLLHGPYALMACVIRGLPPADLRLRFTEVLEDIHQLHGVSLRNFDGDQEKMLALQHELQHCLVSEQKPSERKKKALSPVFSGILLLIALLLIWWAYLGWQDWRDAQLLAARHDALLTQLRRQPGVVVTEVTNEAGLLSIYGLHDPLAVRPERFIADNGLTQDQVQMNWSPYQDMSPELALRRARHVLQPPSDIELTLSEGVLQAQGVADAEWTRGAISLAPLIPGVERLDVDGLLGRDQYLLDLVSRQIGPPEGVRVEVKDGHLKLTGEAPLAWIQAVDAKLAALTGLKGMDVDGLESLERQELQVLIDEIGDVRLRFAEGSELLAAQAGELVVMAERLKSLSSLAAMLRLQPQVEVIGRTDGVGSRRFNERLGKERAQVFIAAMQQYGVEETLFQAAHRLAPVDMRREEPSLRRVELHVKMLPQSQAEEGEQRAGL